MKFRQFLTVVTFAILSLSCYNPSHAGDSEQIEYFDSKIQLRSICMNSSSVVAFYRHKTSDDWTEEFSNFLAINQELSASELCQISSYEFIPVLSIDNTIYYFDDTNSSENT